MHSISRALSRLHEDGSWFARAQELRLLVARTSGDLRKAALKQLQQLEFHADSSSPWVALDTPRAAEDDGWQARANCLAEEWERRRQAFAKEAKRQRDEALRKAGIDPRYLEEAPRLRTLVVGAALAMKQGRGVDAIRQQREARDLCDSLAMHQVKVICQIALASYLSGLGHEREAMRELEAAALEARTHRLPVRESQAHLALGLLHALGRRRPQAMEAYVQAARAAEAGQSPLMAIEAWRLAGQLAAEEDLSTPATRAFREAIRIASGAEPAVAKVSSAPEAARALAALCRRHQLVAQADSLEAQARAMEQGEAAKATAGGSAARHATASPGGTT